MMVDSLIKTLMSVNYKAFVIIIGFKNQENT